MALINWIIRSLALAFVARLILRAVLGSRGSVRGRQAARKVERAGGTLERDPQCGTYVPRTAAVTARAGGRTLYFCSASCRDTHLSAHTQDARTG
jgi:YHS domain-containing protein